MVLNIAVCQQRNGAIAASICIYICIYLDLQVGVYLAAQPIPARQHYMSYGLETRGEA